jgi:hypothetical protein
MRISSMWGRVHAAKVMCMWLDGMIGMLCFLHILSS